MGQFREDFPEASRERPCPVCGKTDWCAISRDGQRAMCRRIAAGAICQTPAGALHHLDGYVPVAPAYHAAPPQQRPRDLSQLVRFLKKSGDEPVRRLAVELGVSETSLQRLGVGWHLEGQYWTFPERDATGRVIGIQRRYPDGSKRRMAETKCGLTYAPDWDTGSGPVLLVEGGSDTAALMDLGVSVIGRPSNMGGVPLFAELLRQFPEDRQIIVLGEHDEKPDRRWPGKEGAVHTASDLAKRLERKIHWGLPPDFAKDARAWLNVYGGPSPSEMQSTFLQGLTTQIILPPPTYRPREDHRPVAEITDYRSAMLAARLRSLDQPGIYVDRSPTGAGKSSIDRELLRSWYQHREAAG